MVKLLLEILSMNYLTTSAISIFSYYSQSAKTCQVEN